MRVILCEDKCTFLSYLAQFILALQMFQTTVVQKIKTYSYVFYVQYFC